MYIKFYISVPIRLIYNNYLYVYIYIIMDLLCKSVFAIDFVDEKQTYATGLIYNKNILSLHARASPLSRIVKYPDSPALRRTSLSIRLARPHGPVKSPHQPRLTCMATLSGPDLRSG